MGIRYGWRTNGGAGIGFPNADYEAAGAHIVASPEEIFASADMVVKVKEPQPNECRMLRPGQLLFTYLHLAPDPEQAKLLLASGATAIAYETVTSPKGGLPLLAPHERSSGKDVYSGGGPIISKKRRAATACSSVVYPG